MSRTIFALPSGVLSSSGMGSVIVNSIPPDVYVQKTGDSMSGNLIMDGTANIQILGTSSSLTSAGSVSAASMTTGSLSVGVSGIVSNGMLLNDGAIDAGSHALSCGTASVGSLVSQGKIEAEGQILAGTYSLTAGHAAVSSLTSSGTVHAQSLHSEGDMFADAKLFTHDLEAKIGSVQDEFIVIGTTWLQGQTEIGPVSSPTNPVLSCYGEITSGTHALSCGTASVGSLVSDGKIEAKDDIFLSTSGKALHLQEPGQGIELFSSNPALHTKLLVTDNADIEIKTAGRLVLEAGSQIQSSATTANFSNANITTLDSAAFTAGAIESGPLVASTASGIGVPGERKVSLASAADISAILRAESKVRGTVPAPVMTEAQWAAIPRTPGLMSFATSGATGRLNIFNGVDDKQVAWTSDIPASVTYYLPYFGDGSDANGTITGSTTLTRDYYYINLTLDPGVVINTNGFRLYVRDVLTMNLGSAIAFNGLHASGQTAGGALNLAGSVGGSTAGGAGGNADAVGTAGTNSTLNIGGRGGRGGDGNANGANGGTLASTGSAYYNEPRSFVWAALGTSRANLYQGGTGGGGGGGATGAFGGGGGGGAGCVYVAANSIVKLGGAANVIQANGGNGGAAESSAAGAGAAGGGGVVILLYKDITPSMISTVQTIAGTAGPVGSTVNLTAGNSGRQFIHRVG